MSYHVGYESIVAREALDFIEEKRDLIVEGLVDESDFDRNDIDGLDEAWHENVTDRAYSDSDARFILDESRNVETDEGLWQGQEPDLALRTQAAYTFSNDVWNHASDLYREIEIAINDRLDEMVIDDRAESIPDGANARRRLVSSDDLTIDAVFDADGDFLHARISSDEVGEVLVGDDAPSERLAILAPEIRAMARVILENDGEPTDRELEEAFRRAAAKRAIAGLVAKAEPTPIAPGSEEEGRELLRHIRAGRNSSRSGYPFGSAYIDVRCGYMYGTSEFGFVWSDRELAKRLPHLVGMQREQLKAYWKENFGGPTPTTPEEMLDKIVRMIRSGADSLELEDVLPEIAAVLPTTPGVRR